MARRTITRDGIYLAWEFPSATGAWEQSEFSAAQQGYAFSVFPLLDERGRRILLEEFELTVFADELPLEKLRTMGWDDLARYKQEREPM